MLSFHAPYRCRDSGACCTAGWPIPIEPDRLARAEHALEAGTLRTAIGAPLAFVRSAPVVDSEPALLAQTPCGCVFYRAQGARRCNIHRALGHGALPLSCRRFPRVSIVDPRGVSTTLSHYCPTARGLLDDASPATVIEVRTDVDDLEDAADLGLDMREALPPLLRAGMFMDWDAWHGWESAAVALIDRSEDVEAALACLRGVVEQVRGWNPGDGPLDHVIEHAFRSAAALPDPAIPAGAHLEAILAAVPTAHRPVSFHATSSTDAPSDREQRRFLAAHAFANWTAHLGEGLRTWLRSLEAASGLLRAGLGIQEADLLLRHLADPAALADSWSVAERG
jgi:Fe-S-cluster containining protein